MSTYKTKPRWTRRQIQFIRDNYETMKDEEISIALGRSLGSVRKKRMRMGLGKEGSRGTFKAK